MPLLAALSCFQGQPAAEAADELLALGFDGLQLTPGCAPDAALFDSLASRDITALTHHGYSPTALKRRVWGDDGSLLSRADSIHPPMSENAEWFWHTAEHAPETLPVIEVMYGRYALGSGRDIRRAIEAGLKLAVDVSHLHIQVCQRTASPSDVDALLAYDNIAEIHLSHNEGARDSHLPLHAGSFGLSWARERANTPVVFEGYLHALTTNQRREQLDIIREALS
jgi:hypothetical protein